MSGYLYLATAIVFEVIATSALKASDGFSNPFYGLVVVLGYSVAFFCLSIVLRTIPVGIAYAIWSGLGIVLITIVGWILFKQTMDLAALAGMGLIISGVIVIHTFSSTVSH